MTKVCIVGASGKLGQHMVQHSLDRGYKVVAVCREKSASKLDRFRYSITVVPGDTNDRMVIEKAVADCDAVLTVLVPWGMQRHSSGTAQAVLDFSRQDARLIFSAGNHITKDGLDVYSRKFKATVAAASWFGRLFRAFDLKDQIEACKRIFASDTKWTVVRAEGLEDGESQGLPVWSHHAGDPILDSKLTRRTDFALFMVDSITNESLVHEAPAIVSREAPSAVSCGV
ncbi:NAD(P)-dependent oxidoreductase [Candidatus Lucifugimonas marina]|uniref:NAD(P)H-binding protein n=1 Tax=Candidatus Lucifugimonas marina TaxID=3038979 RepID=A0AAJ5ZJ32_9CHLR|nr:NAD(P)H-binding protein [SAR202 cluster bacterium JH639]WFG39677.1 NAD(P)H-binding protein [SAR202 cluster bacterium JH1073]